MQMCTPSTNNRRRMARFSVAIMLVMALLMPRSSLAFTTVQNSRSLSAVAATSRVTGSVQKPPQYGMPHLEALQMSSSVNDGEQDEFLVKVKVDPVVRETSLLLRRLSWAAWWAQMILTTVSSVTLLFARNVIGASSSPMLNTSSLPNFVLAGTGIGLSFCSIVWTWASRRLARRLLRKPTTKIQTATLLRKSIQVGVTLNLFGMLVSLISAEQIVGALAIKVLTAGTPARSTAVALLESSSSFLQPLDILVVQANTNTLFSHFSSLASLLYMTRSLAKLDPPSREEQGQLRSKN